MSKIIVSSFLILNIIFSQTDNKKQTNYLENFDFILNNFVDKNGKVDYSGIRQNPYHFNEYFNFIKNISPYNHPELFLTEDDKKAYWINVYNALILKLMIDNPDKNILDISFFRHLIFLKKFIIGGKKISPYKIENKILRKKYQDPRIHFAVNCASNSCPPLGNKILTGDSLDFQLNNKTIEYINNPSNIIIDHNYKIIYLNKIFKWYKKDFIKEFNTINEYIYHYLLKKNFEVDKKTFLSYKIKFDNYDWSINKQ